MVKKFGSYNTVAWGRGRPLIILHRKGKRLLVGLALAPRWGQQYKAKSMFGWGVFRVGPCLPNVIAWLWSSSSSSSRGWLISSIKWPLQRCFFISLPHSWVASPPLPYPRCTFQVISSLCSALWGLLMAPLTLTVGAHWLAHWWSHWLFWSVMSSSMRCVQDCTIEANSVVVRILAIRLTNKLYYMDRFSCCTILKPLAHKTLTWHQWSGARVTLGLCH